MNTNENSIFIENLQVQNTHSFNNPLVDTNERIPLDKQEVWIDRSLIPSIPPLPDVFPGGAISGPVRGISGVLLTSLNSSPRQFKYQGTGTQQFANMVPASYFNNTYRPTLRDSKGKVVPYNPNVWVADGLLSIVEFKSDTPVSLGYSPPFTIDYWQYIGPTASSWSSGGSVNLVNLGTGTQIYNSNTAFGIRSITTGSGLTAEVTPDSEMINLENTLTAVNEGDGAGIFINKTDNNLNFRSLLSSEDNITFVENSDTIDVNINTFPLTKIYPLEPLTFLGNPNLSPNSPSEIDFSTARNMLDIDNLENITLSTWEGSNNIHNIGSLTILEVGSLQLDQDIISSNTGVINSNAILDMTNNNIINIGSINSQLIPASNIVGINDVQTLYNKTINASQLENYSIYGKKIASGEITLDKLKVIPLKTILGNKLNNEEFPTALNVDEVKTMLNLSGTNTGDQTISLIGDVTGTWGKGEIINSITNGVVSLAKLAKLPADTIIGNNNSDPNGATPIALNIDNVKTMLNLSGTNTGDQAITLAGNVTGTWENGTIQTSIANGVVSLANFTKLPANTIIGNNNSDPNGAIPIALTATQVKTMLELSSGSITLDGAITGIGVGTINTTIPNKSINLEKFADLPGNTIIGNKNDGLSTPIALTASEVKSMLGILTGDITLEGDIIGNSSTGTIQTNIANGVVSLANLAKLPANTIIGNNNSDPNGAIPIALTATQVKTMLELSSGSITLDGAITGIGVGTINTTIQDNAVTLSKLANIPANTIIGNNTDGLTGAVPKALIISEVKDMLNLSGNNTGDQAITLQGDVTGTWADGFITTNITDETVGLSNIVKIPINTILGNNTSTLGGAVPKALTASEVKTIIGAPTINLIGDLEGSLVDEQLNTTIKNGVVSLTKMKDLDPLTIIGNDTENRITPKALTKTEIQEMFNISGTNTGDQAITLQGDVTGTWANGFITTNIANERVELSNIVKIPINTILGNNTSTLGGEAPKALTVSEVKTMLGINSTQNLSFTGDVTLGTLQSDGTIPATISNRTVSFAKMAALSGNTIIGNNTASTSDPKALDAGQVKSLLSLDEVANININTWNGSTFINTLGTINTLNAGTLNVSSSISSTGTNSNLTLNATGNGAINCGTFNLKANTILPSATTGDLTLNAAGSGAINCGAFNLKVSNIVNNGSITLNANQGTSDVLMVCPLDMSTNDIKNASSITSQTITSKEVVINNTVVNSNSDLNIDGVTTTKSRQIICKQNNALQCSFGLSGSTNFFVKDLSTNPTANLLELTLGTANRASALKLPTYTSNGLLRIDSGTVTVDSNFTTSSNTINVDTVTAKTTNSNLTLNGNGTGTVNTNAPYIYIANNRIDTDTSITLDGTTVTKSRYVACYQNAVHKLGFGLAASSYFFIWDNVNARDLFQASIITGNIRFPTYSTNGILRIDSGDVSVDTNFTTSSNTINVDTVRAKTTNSDLFLHPNGTGTVVTNSPVIYIASNRVDTDSRFSIDGPTITNGRYIACYQNGFYKLGFGLQSSTHFFIWDNVNERELFRANISDGKIRFPTYTNGILRITDGTVAVDSNFTTSTNTINCNNISSNTTTLLLNGVGINANVATNNSAFILRSTVANENSYVSIGGPTTTNSRFVAYFQNDIHIFSSGLQKTDNYFCYDVVNNRTLFALDIGAPNPVRFPTYTTDGSLSVSTFVSGSTSVPGILVRSSDRRLKKNEETLNSADSLQKIMNLQPKKYCWKSDSSNRVKIGFIAQDVESEIPEAIDGKKYEYELVRDGAGPGVDGTVRVDEEGNPVLDYDKPRYRGLDQCAILSTLVSAFQELTNRLNESNSKILNLTNQLAESESKVLELNIRLLNLESKI